MSFLQLVLSLDKTKEEIILLWRICQFDRYRNRDYLLKNQRIIVHCDNQAVVAMINNSSSSCKNCMYLLRLLTLNNLVHNRRVFAVYVSSKDNDLADALSRLQFDCFWKLASPKMNKQPCKVSELVWPPTKKWIN